MENNLNIPESFEKRFEETLKNLPDKKMRMKYKYKTAASVALITLISTGIVMGISDQIYKYIPNNGYILESDKSIYALQNPIKLKYDKKYEMDINMIMYEEYGRAIIALSGKIEDPNIVKSELQIGNKIYQNTNIQINNYENSWGIVDKFEKLPKYKPNEKIKYNIYFENGESVHIDMSLNEVKGVSSYEKLGETSLDKDISITAVVNEEQNNLKATFVSKYKEGDTFITVGTDGRINNDYSGLKLIDANNKEVYGLRDISGGTLKSNVINFNTKGNTKPYKIVVPYIRVDKVVDVKGISEEVILEVPKNNDTVEINREIKIPIEKNIVNSENNTIKLIRAKRQNNKYILEIEYPENNMDGDKLIQVAAIKENFLGKKEIFAIGKYDKDNDKVIETIEFDINLFTKKIKFKLTPISYEIKGNWEYNIK